MIDDIYGPFAELHQYFGLKAGAEHEQWVKDLRAQCDPGIVDEFDICVNELNAG